MILLDRTALGWDERFEQEFLPYMQKAWEPARVISREFNQYTLAHENGLYAASLSGKFLYHAQQGDLPVVGDWVAVERKNGCMVIHALVPRKTCFARKPAISGGRKLKNGVIDGGITAKQALAANIDTIFIVNGLDGNFSTGRIERYLTITAGSGASPVLLLNKVDLCEDINEYTEALKTAAPSVTAHAISVKTGYGMEALDQYLLPGKTVVFLGSSGVGKSTIINSLFGEELLATGEVSQAHGKGRHTTSRAIMLCHRSGCMLIDTPGLRELQLWCDEKAVEDSFADVVEAIGHCRFSDCGHKNEPGCGVRQAIADGTLPAVRYESYRRLYGEVWHLNARRKQLEIALGRREKHR